jgi:hypothetical protein
MATNSDQQNQQEKINTDIITLTRFLTEEQSKHKEATGDFTCVKRRRYVRPELMYHPDFYAMPFNLRSRALPTTFGEPHWSTYVASKLLTCDKN